MEGLARLLGSGELGKEVAKQPDVAADVKGSLDALAKDVAAIAAKFAQPVGQRGGGGGRGGANESLLARIGQAKNGLMGGFWPTSQTLDAYGEAKTATPKAIAEANALFGKAATLSATLATYKLTLTAPKPVEPR